MALSGIEIFKQLPKTNCKECEFPTCLAFAMSLAQGKTELAKCPHVSEEAKASLSAASEPPMRTVTIGANGSATKVGGETVLFRHEKTFVNPTALAILIDDGMDDAEVDARIAKLGDLQYDRVGLTLKADLVAVKDTQGNAARFAAIAGKAAGAGCGLILMTADPAVAEAGLKACEGAKPLLYGVNGDNVDQMAALAKANGCSLGVAADGIEAVMAVTEKLAGMEIKDLVIDAGARDLASALKDQIAIRRAALSGKCKPLGFPTIAFPGEMTDDPTQEIVVAAAFIAKYAGLVVLSDFDGAGLFPLLLERLNIFTDHLRDRRPGRELARARHLQLLPDLLHRLRRDRGQPGALLHAGEGHRGAFCAHRLGRGQVHRR